ncbi:MAG: sodium:solute symporter family protein [Cyclobacteriaceae bacterium]
MSTWFIIFGIFYIGVLAFVGFSSWKRTKSAEDYILGGSSLGTIIGMMTFAATLFSTFTLMGMPDFFRLHGIGAWIFLAISDAAMFFFILWFGYHLRKRAGEMKYQGVSGLMSNLYRTRWAGYIYFVGVFLFLVPYVAIQIRGIAIFLNAVFPEALPAWGWSTIIVIIMLSYSEIGGLRAIIYNDVIQGFILLIVLWIIAAGCISYFGSIGNLFAEVKAYKPELLSVPGPNGLLTTQFLFASFLAIIFIPVTQPQVATRLVIMRSTKTLHSMAVGLGIFAFLVLLPTIAIGLYGAIQYAGKPSSEFLSGVLLYEQLDWIAAIVIIGLLAAATSTADSQIFALGSELRSMLLVKEEHKMKYTRFTILFFAVAALVFSVLSSDQLVLLARVSFAGTSILAPLILSGIFNQKKPPVFIIPFTALGVLTFLGSLAGIVPELIFGIRIELLVLGFLFLLMIVGFIRR